MTKVSGATLSWAESASPGATIPVDDDRRSATPNGFMTATGLDSNQTGTVRAEATAAAPVFYHVVRVADSCGSKGGTDSADVDIPATTCP